MNEPCFLHYHHRPAGITAYVTMTLSTTVDMYSNMQQYERYTYGTPTARRPNTKRTTQLTECRPLSEQACENFAWNGNWFTLLIWYFMSNLTPTPNIAARCLCNNNDRNEWQTPQGHQVATFFVACSVEREREKNGFAVYDSCYRVLAMHTWVVGMCVRQITQF